MRASAPVVILVATTDFFRILFSRRGTSAAKAIPSASSIAGLEGLRHPKSRTALSWSAAC
jgi:hypothetical protein